MNRTDRYLRIISILLFAVLGGLFVLFIAVNCSSLPAPDMLGQKRCEILSSGWTQILPDDGSEKDVSLPGTFETDADSTAVLETALPDTIPEGSWISTRSATSELRVYVNDVLRYSYSLNDSPFSKGYTTTGLVFVKLKPSDEGKILRLEARSDTMYRGYVDTVYNGDRAGILAFYFTEHGLEVILAIMLFLFGLAIIVLSLVMEVRTHTALELKFLALGVVFFAGWSLTECFLRQFLFPHVDIASFAAFIFKFLMPLPFAVYMDEIQKRRYHRLYLILEAVTALSAGVFFILHMTGLLPYIYSIPAVIIDVVICIAAIFVTVIRDIRRKKLDYQLIAVGMGIFFLSGLVSIPGYMQGSGNMNKSLVLLGLMALAIFAVLKAVIDAERAKEEKKEALALSNSKSRFLASMSHEIRTPINTVLGMNEMIERECTDENILAYADNIGTAGRMLLSLINDILDFSKIESGKMELTETPYQTASVINDCVTLLKKRADEKGLKMILSCDSSLPSALVGDDVRITQIITNILTNAVKYTEKGSVTLTVTGHALVPERGQSMPPEKERFPASEKGQGEKDFLLVISVRDTGIGIKEEAMGDLFTDFSRMDQTRNRHIEGTGLGLAITKLLVEAMGGKISVQSVYGEGSLFTVEIPQKISDARPMGKFEENNNSAAQTDKKKYEPSFTAPDARILVVDDNRMNRMVFKALLKQTAIKIDQAADGLEALALTREQKYDMIFMDHMMPAPDGIETLKMLRAEEGNPNRDTCTIALTANAIAGIDRMYRDAGFQDYLTKPVVPVKLERMIIAHLPKELVTKKE